MNWKLVPGDSVGQAIVDWLLLLTILGIIASLLYNAIILHDPAKAAAFNPCDHPAPHKRPPSCVKK